jgi:peptidoglycan hydrolase-like protein with peptidoglycan-binding domain/chitodextrinase
MLPVVVLAIPVFASALSLTHVLALGSSEPDVSALQQYLIDKGYLTGTTATGYFGRMTEAAVAKLQAVHGLEPVGSVGPKTRALLNSGSVIAPFPSTTQAPSTTSTGGACDLSFTSVLAIGHKGDQVSALQRFLISKGLLAPDSATGFFGKLTMAAVAAFQSANGLESVGSVGPKSRALIASLGCTNADTQTPPASTPSAPTTGGGGAAGTPSSIQNDVPPVGGGSGAGSSGSGVSSGGGGSSSSGASSGGGGGGTAANGIPAGWPNSTNTGYRNAPGYPGSLHACSGPIQSNTTYSFCDFNGGVSVGTRDAPVSNVTFYGSRFHGAGESLDVIALYGDNITIDYSSIEPAVSAPPVSHSQGYYIGIDADGSYYTNVGKLTVTHSDIWGFAGAIATNGSTQAKPHVFRDNWIHDPRADGGVDHTDGIGETSGFGNSSYVVIDHNSVLGVGNTNGLAYQAGTYSNFSVTNNYFSGFGYTINLGNAMNNSSNFLFSGNTFGTNFRPDWGPLYGWGGTGNVWKCNYIKFVPGTTWTSGGGWKPVASDDGKFWTPNGVSATDYLGNTSCGTMTPPPPDTTVPSTPAGLTATAISSSQINLSWSASTDAVGVTEYRVFRGGTQVGTPTGTTYSDTGLTASTAYSYTVRAVDAAGNLSANSSTASATTQAASTGTTIPLTWNDSMFNSAVTSNAVVVPAGGSVSYKSITDTGSIASVVFGNGGTMDHVRINSREGVRVGGSGTFNITNSYIETTGVADDHADGIQAYSPGDSGTLNISNSSIVSHTSAATAGLFIADNWTGTINLTDVVVNGGPYGIRIYPDTGGDNHLNFTNVYFVGPFGYGDFIVDADWAGHTNYIDTWNNVRSAIIVNGVLVPGALIPCPGSHCPSGGGTSDTTAPSTPAGLTATAISSSQINLSWSASTDNVAVTGYRVYRGGTQIGTSASNSYSDSGLIASTAYSYTVSAYDAAGNNSGHSSIASATTQAAAGGGGVGGASYSIFTMQTPAGSYTDGPGQDYELGTKLTSTAAGQITGIRFYKSASESGTHTGRIWSNAGTELATVAFSGETASGWQTATLATPLSISANTTYVVSVNTGNAYYVATNNGLTSAITNGPLSTVVGNNGVYGNSGAFPTTTWQASNYFRDVVFVADN